MWELCGFSNESDVEQKLLAPLLFTDIGLGCPPSEVKTKKYIHSCNIGKRRSKKGHIPDYLVYAAGLPCLAIEAKAPDDNLVDALREAAEYALEINRSFPPKLNPLRWVVACNGQALVVAEWDNAVDAQEFAVADLKPACQDLERLRRVLHYAELRRHATDCCTLLNPGQWYNPMRLAGGTPVQGLTLQPNRFAAELYPLMTRFLAKDAGRDSPEIVKRAYVESDERTEFESILESLMKDNLSRKLRPQTIDISTGAKKLTASADQFMSYPHIVKSTTTLLIGGIGSGKSIFLDRFRQCYMSDDLAERTLWLVLDFNEAPDDAREYRRWIETAFVRAVADEETRQRSIDIYSLAHLRKLFGRRIAKKKNLLHGGIGGLNDEDFERHIRAEIDKWADLPDAMVEAIFHHYKGEMQLDIVVVFDNGDKRTSEDQLAVFQNAISFGAEHQCDVLVAMRDETFDIYSARPPLDAISKHRIFRVHPPRLIDVVKKRLDLMIEYLDDHMPRKLRHCLAGGVEVEYDRDELRQYLKKVYDDLFSSSRAMRVVLEALAGKNIRKALEMFVSILASPYLENRVGFATMKSSRPIPEWLVIRSLMRGRYAFYSDTRDDVFVGNIFQVAERSKSTNNFVISEILAILTRERKRTGQLGIEGYQKVERLLNAPELMGYSREDVLWALNYCIKLQLITSESTVGRAVTDDSFVKITASGFYHLKFFVHRQEYYNNVAMSTWMRDEDAANGVLDTMQIAKGGNNDRDGRAAARFRIFIEYLGAAAAQHRQVASAEPERLGGVNSVSDGIEEIIAFGSRSQDRGPTLFRSGKS